jgi:hypothetical protein
MKIILIVGFVFSVFGSANVCQVAQAQQCTSCNSGSCTQCTVKVGVYGYSRPTWRPWPTTKHETPSDRQKINRRLIRPQPYETPAPESEADGLPSLIQPGRSRPGLDPMPTLPEDQPPALPPQLRNKQPIPIDNSTMHRRHRSTRANTPELANSAVWPTATARALQYLDPDKRQPVQVLGSRPARAIAVNVPVSAQIPTAQRSMGTRGNDNPLRLTSHRSTGAIGTKAVQTVTANMPMTVGSKTDNRPSTNPLR